ncbi:MAG: FtsQ-type POTRA domain-containing protein, partial [Cyanobacteria bacterium REEB65]|nr:FtsQ-type POTRA domain-containing protein [Cyanobacteria bacterium REEB65]
AGSRSPRGVAAARSSRSGPDDRGLAPWQVSVPAMVSVPEASGIWHYRSVRRLVTVIELVVLGVLLVVAWRAPQWRWEGQYVVEGARIVSADALVKRLPQPVGEPLYLIDPRPIRAAALAFDPTIGAVEVRRWLFPARIVVSLHEREPAARVAEPLPVLANVSTRSSKPGLPLCLDVDGEAFACRPTVLPLAVRVAAIPLPGQDQEGFVNLAEAWPADATGVADLRDPASWSCRIQLPAGTGSVGAFRVFLGDAEHLRAKFRALEQVFLLTRRDQKTLEYVDVRFPDAPAFKAADGAVRSERAFSRSTGSENGQHGQGLADTGNGDRADRRRLVGHPVQESGLLRAGGSAQPPGRGPGGHAQGQ